MSVMFLAADDWIHIGFRLILALLVVVYYRCVLNFILIETIPSHENLD